MVGCVFSGRNWLLLHNIIFCLLGDCFIKSGVLVTSYRSLAVGSYIQVMPSNNWGHIVMSDDIHGNIIQCWRIVAREKRC